MKESNQWKIKNWKKEKKQHEIRIMSEGKKKL